ncbi:zinc ribbon domain-containing protein [Pseudomonas sp. 21LCFQ02]|uniref:zinc-ribbon domain-containing protein n=1 Tax=unclassified Pseudomonas TaxID=196821 RepID=UPI0004F66581|nr:MULTISPECIES: zinc ribbon domain-containing protein [unclassified Pseudomonas]MCO8160930.1 zinc ribbon domain-containing protein [Pseudomonas sp. 21LCFQ010]MCO8166934.1 zinc ribbon domain-containing protein [Pseudomonas sp. 21LCFQ02]MCQ9423335.1 zinc ribbon domain-containing protein [Pseudomonas sp. LJDD11]BAP44693.1 phage integrase [Pseudomonas sp. StFLB209]
MSLIDCPECNARISDKAYACPQCGNPMNAGPGNRLLSEKNIGQIAGATGVWLTAPWIARMIFGVVLVIAGAAVLIFR